MGQSNFLDEIECESFFDHIDDLIDFPADDIVEDVSNFAATNTTFNETNDSGNYQFSECDWSAQCNSLPVSASDLSAELSVPYEDIVQLEWLSNFVEDSFSGEGSLTMKKEDWSSSLDKNKSNHQFRTSSPVSVLESSSSCSGEKVSPRSPEVVAAGRRGRARSKRPRPAMFTPRPAMQQLVSPTSSLTRSAQPVITPKRPLDGEGFAESRLIVKIRKPVGLEEKKKKKKIKITVPAPPVQIDPESSLQQAVRKCMHCEITKTPQWRAGPMGPKTLCNACGVRFKSGRLFPEYRPAASPTFIPALHSNSHKKVLEMRNKDGEKVSADGGATMITKSEELIPNNGNILMDYK